MQGISVSSIRPQPKGRAGRHRFLNHIRRQRLKLYLRPLLGQSYPTTTRFVILSQMRAGSNLLRSLLNCHTQVFCHDELFRYLKTFNVRLLLDNASKAHPEPVSGYMIKPYHPVQQAYTTDDWIEWMREAGYRLIQLRREDELRQSLSIYAAYVRMVWIERRGSERVLAPLVVDVEHLVRILLFLRSWKKVVSRWMERLPAITITYERDLLDTARHQATADAIFKFLGIESEPVRTNLAKVLPSDPREFVTNWDEVVAAIAQLPS